MHKGKTILAASMASAMALLVTVSASANKPHKQSVSENEASPSRVTSEIKHDPAPMETEQPDWLSQYKNDPDFHWENFSASQVSEIRDRESTFQMHSFETPSDGLLKVALLAGCDPDKSMSDADALLDIHIFGDGVPLEFRFPNDPENSGFSTVHRLDVSSLIKNIDMEIDLRSCGEIETIAMVSNFHPQYIPKKGLGEYRGCIMFLLENSACTYKLLDSDTPENRYFDISSEYGGRIDVGCVSLEKGEILTCSDKISERHFFDDVKLDPRNKELYIKFNGKNGYDFPYYVILFRDGELLDVFDGEYSRLVNCLSGTRTFQFKIPESYIPDEGLHTFQAAAIPAYSGYQTKKYIFAECCTNKIRVKTYSAKELEEFQTVEYLQDLQTQCTSGGEGGYIPIRCGVYKHSDTLDGSQYYGVSAEIYFDNGIGCNHGVIDNITIEATLYNESGETVSFNASDKAGRLTVEERISPSDNYTYCHAVITTNSEAFGESRQELLIPLN